MKHYSKRDIESWQLTGRRSSYKYISRLKHPVIGQLPSNSIFMDKTTVQNRIFSDNLRVIYFFFIYIYISLCHFSLFFILSWSLSLPLSPLSAHAFTGVVDLLPQIQDRWIHARFSTFPESLSPLLNRSTFCPESSEFWLRVVKQMFGESARTRACNQVLHGKRRIC